MPSALRGWLACVSLLAGCGARPDRALLTAPGPPSAEAPAGATITTGPETCSNAADDNQNGLIDEGCGLPLGLVQFLAAWGAAKADVDLRVVDPNGELVEVGRVARSGLTKDRDCPGRGTECQGANLENVYLTEGEPLRGEYRLRVRLESLGGESPPVRVALGTRLGPITHSYEVLLETPDSEHEIRVKF